MGCRKKRLCHRPRLLCTLLCYLGHVFQQLQWGLKCQWQRGKLFGALGSLCARITGQALRILEQNPAILSDNYSPFHLSSLGPATGLTRE